MNLKGSKFPDTERLYTGRDHLHDRPCSRSEGKVKKQESFMSITEVRILP